MTSIFWLHCTSLKTNERHHRELIPHFKRMTNRSPLIPNWDTPRRVNLFFFSSSIYIQQFLLQVFPKVYLNLIRSEMQNLNLQNKIKCRNSWGEESELWIWSYSKYFVHSEEKKMNHRFQQAKWFCINTVLSVHDLFMLVLKWFIFSLHEKLFIQVLNKPHHWSEFKLLTALWGLHAWEQTQRSSALTDCDWLDSSLLSPNDHSHILTLMMGLWEQMQDAVSVFYFVGAEAGLRCDNWSMWNCGLVSCVGSVTMIIYGCGAWNSDTFTSEKKEKKRRLVKRP